MKLSMITIKFRAHSTNILQILEGLNLRESTNVNFENDENCENMFGNECFCFEDISKRDNWKLIKALP